jgi:GMP synthase (glutamine-hydrolysing)
MRSVGVQGDERTYAYPIVIRTVTSEDAMTADRAPALRLAGDDLQPVHQRDSGREPGRARHLLEAAQHDRVGRGRARPERASSRVF